MPDEHIRFHCVEARQGEQSCLYLGMLRFDLLKELYTVSPREARTDDPYSDDGPAPRPQYPQRAERPERLREISSFIEERLKISTDSRKQIIFPGTVILGLLTDIEAHVEQPINPTPSAAHLLPGDNGSGCLTILLSRKQGSLFIIDGQHRIKGLRALYDRIKDQIDRLDGAQPQSNETKERLDKLRPTLRHVLDFNVPISLLVDFDLEEQAMVFATVNFQQKPVQRSFYYDIFGAFESEKVTAISFSHELAIHLNNSTKSPLKDMIKLLGVGPGLISQAFLVARLEPLVDPQSSKAVFRSFFLRRRAGEKDASAELAAIVRSFFAAVRDEFPYAWPTRNAKGNYSAFSYDFILMKSMVVSGLLAVLREIYKISLLDFAGTHEADVAEAEIFDANFFRPFFRNIDSAGRASAAKSVFHRNSGWAVGGSSKIERLIFESFRRDIFATYKELLRDESSMYSLLCVRHNGPKTAAEIAERHESDVPFWSETEARWQETFFARGVSDLTNAPA